MLDFNFELNGAGGANSHFQWAGGEFGFPLEPGSDPVSRLAAQGRWFVDGEWRAYQVLPEVAFSDARQGVYLNVDPKSFKFTWSNETWDEIRSEILELTLTFSPSAKLIDHPPLVPLSVGQMSVADYVRMIFRELNALWEAHGLDGYRANWPPHEFPLADFITIGQLLDAPPPIRRLWS